MSSNIDRINSPAWMPSPAGRLHRIRYIRLKKSSPDCRATITSGSADGQRRSPRLTNLLVVAAWVAAAVIANLLLTFTQAEPHDTSPALLPQDAKTAAATSRIAQAFPGTGSNAIAYLVVEGGSTLEPQDQPYYDAAVGALRADTRHVVSVLDWWSDPVTAPLGTSPDGRSATAMVWLRGEAGTTQAAESLDAVRSVLRQLPPSEGLRASIVVPAITNDMPMQITAWQSATIVTVAAVIAVLLLLRARLSVRAAAIVLLTADLSLAVAWPLAAVVRGHDWGTDSVFSWTLAAVLTIGTITAATMLAARLGSDAGHSAAPTYRDSLPAFALPGACVAIFTGPLLLARTPALHGVGTAGLGVFVALAASLTVLPALIALAGASRQLPAPTTGAGWTGRLSLPVSSASALGTAAVLAICMLPIIGMRWGVAENPTRQGGAQVLPGNALPDVVVIKSARDLRDPAALIAINQVSHRLVEVPGVRKVESAAWPAGVPWTDASLSSAAGRLADQLGQQAGSFVPAVTAIKSMKSIIEQMSGAVDQLDSTVNVTLAGARQAQQYLDPMLAAARNLKNKTTELSEYLETIHTWIVGFTNCPDDVLCTAMRKVIEPYDIVVTGMNELSTGADRISAISTQTMSALSSAPRMVAQMRSALAQVRSFVPKLETTIQDAMPQIAQASAMLKNLSADFADTGEGGFHLSRKDLADPSYRHVRESMFSSDGTATRLFLYSDGQLDLAAAARAQQLEIAAGKAMKYGSLVDSQVTVGGAAQIAAAVRDALIHDAVLLAVILLTVVALASMWRGAVHGAAVGVGVLASYLAALGVSIALWQHLLDRELNALVPLVSFAVLASCGVPYLVAGIKAGRIADEATGARSKGAVSGRGAVAPLAALGGVFGAGLVLVSGGSFSVLSQIGTVVVLGLGVLITVQRAWLPTTPGRR